MGNPIGKWFEVFRTGTHTDSAGEKATWTETDLDAIVENFSGETPITISHPDADPVVEELRWGVLDGVKREGSSLFARIGSMVPELGAIFSNGMLPQRSVGITGNGNTLKLSHLALLGVTPPAVKGMEALAFKASDTVRTFEAPGMTDEPMEDMGWLKKALSIIMEKIGVSSDMACADGKKKNEYSEPSKEIDMTEQEKKDLEAKVSTAEAALATANAEKAAVEAKFSEAEKKIREFEAADAARAETVRKAEFSAFVDAQIAAGRLLPADKDAQVTIMSSLDAQTEHEFSAADGAKVKKTALKLYQESIEGGKVILQSGQFSAEGSRRTLDGAEQIDALVQAEIKANPSTNYSAAMSAVLIQHPELNTAK